MSPKLGKIHWISCDSTIRVEEALIRPTREEIDKFVGGDHEFISVQFNDKKNYMLVNEMPRPYIAINEAATDIYHKGIREQCAVRFITYRREDYQSIRGAVVIIEGLS